MRAEFRRVGLWRRDFGYRIAPGVPRWAPAIQVERRTVLARSRNHLLFRALEDEAWVLWLDVDVVAYPPDLVERLLARGERVTVLDDLSTGRDENLQTVREHPSLAFRKGSITDPVLLAEVMQGVDVVYHLAAAVGVKLVADDPVSDSSRRPPSIAHWSASKPRWSTDV